MVFQTFWIKSTVYYMDSHVNRLSMEVLEIKREIETLSDRLGKTQDYL